MIESIKDVFFFFLFSLADSLDLVLTGGFPLVHLKFPVGCKLSAEALLE